MKTLYSYSELSPMAKRNVSPDATEGYLFSEDGKETYMAVSKIPLDSTAITAFLSRNWYNKTSLLLVEHYGTTTNPINVLGQSFRQSLDAILLTLQRIGPCGPEFGNFRTGLRSVFLKRETADFRYVFDRSRPMVTFSVERNRNFLTEDDVYNLFLFVVAHHTDMDEKIIGRASTSFPIEFPRK